ncbi:MAG TPA: hypothetical protein VM187_03680, partial [Niastella sp.]|nr:hypothetical protein [Niastella sp.]
KIPEYIILQMAIPHNNSIFSTITSALCTYYLPLKTDNDYEQTLLYFHSCTVYSVSDFMQGKKTTNACQRDQRNKS